MPEIVLALTYHDPEGRLAPQMERTLPALLKIFDGLAVQASAAASPQGLARLRSAGGVIEQNTPEEDAGPPRIGRSRRRACRLALESGADWVLSLDADRGLHWAEFHLAELAAVAETLPSYDFTILGRTPRAFNTHPRFQTETERLINHVFALVSGREWDVTAAARGLSRRAAQKLLAESQDDGLSTDVSWPLLLAQAGGFSFQYFEAEGLEYETADRYPEAVAQAGGVDAWIAGLEANPERWVQRLRLALEESEAALPFWSARGEGPLGPFDNQRD